jgi:hypothetical protein
VKSSLNGKAAFEVEAMLAIKSTNTPMRETIECILAISRCIQLLFRSQGFRGGDELVASGMTLASATYMTAIRTSFSPFDATTTRASKDAAAARQMSLLRGWQSTERLAGFGNYLDIESQ